VMTLETYSLPDLAYDYGALEPAIAARIMELHHSKHHATYVKGANAALERLHTLRAHGEFDTITMLEKDLAFNLSGHVLHSIFWQNLSPDGGGAPNGQLAEQLGATFGSLDTFKAHFTRAAATIQGSGWAMLAWEPAGGRMVIHQVYDHQGNHGQGTVPLLVFDAWEHAYYLQYHNDKVPFFDALWDIVDWADVADRLVGARRLELSLAL
jgi:Fe-Mn family superoxide dismutase